MIIMIGYAYLSHIAKSLHGLWYTLNIAKWKFPAFLFVVYPD